MIHELFQRATRKVGHLGMRILALSLILLLLVQAATFTVIRARIDRNARAAIAEDLAVSERALQRLLRENERSLADGARVLAADYGFRDTLGHRDDAETIRSALSNHARRLGASVAAVLDTRYQLWVATDDGVAAVLPAVLARMAAERGAQASPGGPAAQDASPGTIEVVAGKPVQFVLVPVKAPVTIAWVLLGAPLDQRLGDDLRDIAGAHLVVLERTDPASTWRALIRTLPQADVDQVAAGLRTQVPKDSISIGPREFGVRVHPLMRDGGSETIAVLLRSVDEAVAPYRELQWVLALLTVLGVVAFGIGSVWTARRVTGPIRELAVAAERLGEGDLQTPIESDAEDEIGDLARTFEQMRKDFAVATKDIEDLAYNDQLTGLPNRTRFRPMVDEAIGLCRGAAIGGRVAVLMMDLDRFKHVNDVLGYESGDKLLKAVADRLKNEALRPNEVVARLGGDEFAVLLQGADAESAKAVAGRIAQAFDRPLRLGDQTVDLSASIGIACWPQHAVDAYTLLSRAEVAMYAAKRSNTSSKLYDPSIDSGSSQNLSMLSELRNALEQSELSLYLQPKVAVGDGRVVGAEALVRWHHPTRGLIPPVHFIPFAEQTGFIRQITQWALDEAARHWLLLRTVHDQGMVVSVNLSARDLIDKDLPAKLDAVLNRHRVPARAFCLEITESATMDDPRRAEATLRQLSERGFRISIDDFGTGYSSLAYLKRLPVDELKIDKSFVLGMERDKDSEKIVRSTIDLAHNMGLSVVAEGVENAAIWNRLHALGCDEAQGYHLSPPLPVPQFIAWQNRWLDRTASGWAGLSVH